MIAAILAGGKGSRMSFDAPVTPKPLAKIGGNPILWHLVKYFHSQDFKEVWSGQAERYDEIVANDLVSSDNFQ